MFAPIPKVLKKSTKMISWTILLLLLIVLMSAYVSAQRIADDDDGEDDDNNLDDQIREATNNDDDDDDQGHVKPWKKYDGLSSSALQPLKNEPYYLARQLQPRIKKYIKKLIGMDKAYCFGELRFRCEKFVCHALRALEQGQFADHINLKACEDIAEPDKMDLQQLKKEHGEFNWSIPNKKSVFTVFKKWSEGVKKFCHKTAHTTDDRCKNKVECLMIEGLKSAWPELVDTKDCGPNALAQYEVKQSTNKVDRALRQKAKKEN